MSEKIIKKISQNHEYELMVAKRNKTSFIFLGAVMLIYFGFIFTLAFNKPFFYEQLNGSVITVGVPIGVSVIFITMFLTIVYGTVYSKSLDEKRKQILKEVKNNG